MKKGIYATILTFIVLSLPGLAGMLSVPVSLELSRTDDHLTIYYSWPGASPEAIEKQATSLIEGAVATLQGIKK